MEVTLGVLFLIIFLSSRLPSAICMYNTTIITSNFQMLQQHPQLRKCVDAIQREHKYFGCQVDELTGECHGLTRSWGLNPTTEKGYAYAKRIDLQESFPHQPLTFLDNDYMGNYNREIPVVFDTGARIDISMSIPNFDRNKVYLDYEVFVIQLQLQPTVQVHSTFGYSREIRIRLFPTYLNISEATLENEAGIKGNMRGEVHGVLRGELPSHFLSRDRFNISVLAQPDSVAVFADDEHVTRLDLIASTRQMKYIVLYQDHMDWGTAFLHKIKYTGE